MKLIYTHKKIFYILSGKRICIRGRGDPDLSSAIYFILARNSNQTINSDISAFTKIPFTFWDNFFYKSF